MQPTNVAILEATYDGAIPPDARRHAEWLDDQARAAAATEAPSPDFLTAPPPKPRSRFATVDALLDAMAGIFVDRATLAGSCAEADLLAAGFAAGEIVEHGPAAKIIAAMRMADRCQGSAA